MRGIATIRRLELGSVGRDEHARRRHLGPRVRVHAHARALEQLGHRAARALAERRQRRRLGRHDVDREPSSPCCSARSAVISASS